MKKIISTVLAGTIMLGLGACSKPAESSETTTVVTTTTTTTEVTTTTTEETTTESTTEETEDEQSFDKLIPSGGEIFVDFSGMKSSEAAENILKAIRLRTNTTAESYANRFEVPPKYSYSKGVWTFDWGKKKPEPNTFGTITITAGNDDGKIVLDEKSSISFKFYIEDYNLGHNTYDRLADAIVDHGESTDYLKGGLAINPRHSTKNISILDRYEKYDFKWCECSLKVGIWPLTDEEKELINQ